MSSARNKYVTPNRKVTWDKRATYPLWYVPEMPLKLLRYRDLEEKDPLGRDWRNALLEDIKARGMQCPLLVANHQLMKNEGGSYLYPDLAMVVNKLYHLRVGRNRRWALEKLGWKTAPCVVSGTVSGLDCASEQITTPERLGEIWTDGHISVDRDMVHVYSKCDPSAYAFPCI